MVSMEGFSEKGVPEDWDMAVGSVRGFRWWRVCLILNQITPATVPRYAPVRQSFADWKAEDPFDFDSITFQYVTIPPDQEWRIIANSPFIGMYRGTWAKTQVDDKGRYQAKCSEHGIQYPNYVPYPVCGCGFWAYWDGLPDDFGSASQPFITKKDKEIKAWIPVAGIIEGSGRVIIGEKGFRSEYARITDLSYRTEAPCEYMDEDQKPEPKLHDYAFGARWISLTAAYGIAPAGPFLPFFIRLTGLSETQIIGSIARAVRQNIGEDYRLWANPEAMLRGAKKDENYSGGIT